MFCGNPCTLAYKLSKSAELFWDKVDKTSDAKGCWIWSGYRQKFGYGWIYRGDGLKSRGVLAHRYAWQLLVGPVPEGKFVLHHCDNPPCVNPAHLYVGSCQENSSDMAIRGRSTRGERSWSAKLTEMQVIEILKRKPKKHSEISAYAERYGVKPCTIRDIVARKIWKHVMLPEGKTNV